MPVGTQHPSLIVHETQVEQTQRKRLERQLGDEKGFWVCGHWGHPGGTIQCVGGVRHRREGEMMAGFGSWAVTSNEGLVGVAPHDGHGQRPPVGKMLSKSLVRLREAPSSFLGVESQVLVQKICMTGGSGSHLYKGLRCSKSCFIKMVKNLTVKN